MTIRTENSHQPSPQAPDFSDAQDPFALFAAWYGDAKAKEINDPNAMALATCDETGMPNVRIVLLKDFSLGGFTFYTNFESTKGRELLASGKGALCFHWKSLSRQVRLRGFVTTVSDQEADDYYVSRPHGSRIGAWASQQSRPLDSRATLEEAVARYAEEYGEDPIPRPSYWSGFRLSPLEFEFWHDRPFRLHDRIMFRRASADQPWRKERLYP